MKLSHNIHVKVIEGVSCILFALMLVLPFQLQVLKGFLLFLVILYSAILIAKRVIIVYMSKKIALWVFLYIFANLFFICYGFLLNNPAPQIYFSIYIIWPLLFVFVLMLLRENSLIGMIKCMRYSLLAILLLGIVAFIKFNLEVMMEGEFLGFIASIRPGFPFIAISGGSITSMIFLYFFFLSFCFLQPKLITKIDKCNIILGVFFIFFTSRRVIFLNFILSFLLIGILIYFVDRKERLSYFYSFRKASLLISLFIVFVFFGACFLGVFEFSDLVDFTGSAAGTDNNDPRIAQMWSLLEGWIENPILGNGTGINASVVRSNLPGTYELTYLAMLFERGIIGTSLFWFQYILLNSWAIKCLKKKVISSYYIISLIVALNLFMIANATNPYLGAFDHLVFLFLLLFVVNLSNKRKYEDLCVN